MHPEEFREMEALEESHWWFRGKRLLLAALLARSGGGRDGRILDLGCGTGGVLHALAGDRPVFGVDTALLALRFCRGKGLSVVGGSAGALPFVPGAFAVCVMMDVLEHLDDERPVLDEVRRVLRPGGVVLVSVPAFQALWSPHDVTFEHRRRYRLAELDGTLRRAGLRVEWSSYTNCAVFLPALAWRTLRRWTGLLPASRTDFFPVPAWLNRALVGLYRGEAALLRRQTLPFGVSAACVARRI